MQARFLTSAAGPEGFPPDTGTEVAVVGRSNSGKSSAINRIVARVGLARVSKTPGRTQLINFFETGAERRLVDLPGYGFARVPEPVRRDWRRLVDSYLRGRQSLNGLLVTVDIRRGLGDLDRSLVSWAGELNLPLTILLTKSDKLSRGAGSATLEAVRRELPDTALVLRFSSLDKTGVDEARSRLETWLAAGE